jgi:hypothetical protein
MKTKITYRLTTAELCTMPVAVGSIATVIVAFVQGPDAILHTVSFPAAIIAGSLAGPAAWGWIQWRMR